MFRSRLACSFCRRDESKVSKLVAGPRVYICDQCAALAVRIMEDSERRDLISSAVRPGVIRKCIDRVVRVFRDVRRTQSAVAQAFDEVG